jgi:hypothetical protein
MTPILPILCRQIEDAIVVSIPAGNYGSTQVDRLRTFQTALADVMGSTANTKVILDMSAVEACGSGFLTCLDFVRSKLIANGRQLVVCGDRMGLLQTVQWSERMQCQRDLASALNLCSRQSA